jgi:uncharacterized protein
MKFYNREKELQLLRTIEKESQSSSKMTVIVGRRRIGKTRLVVEAYKTNIVYLFVSKKNELLLCEEFVSIIEESLGIKVLGEFRRFIDLFEYLLIQSKNSPFSLVIDEFQEFANINPSLYSDMQNIWDKHKEVTKLNLILSGSIYSMMKKIFEDKNEPLFDRANNKINLKPFGVDTLKQIINDNYKTYTNADLLAFYVLTGGVAKYVELFVDAKAFTLEAMLNLIFSEYSLFLEEGKNILIEEFGKEYTTYFSILSLISSAKTARSDMESILGKNIGGYLGRLESEYSLIRKVKPILAKEGSRSLKYEIVDNFLSFWFRFIYKYKSAIEIENYAYVKDIVSRDFSMFSGRFLERYFIQKLILSGEFSTIGTYWEKSTKNEIDIVAVNESCKKLLICEVKLNKEKIDLAELKIKSKNIAGEFGYYNIEYKALSLEDM